MALQNVGSRTIAPEENFPLTLKLTLTLTQTLTPIGRQFSSGAIVRIPKTLVVFSPIFGANTKIIFYINLRFYMRGKMLNLFMTFFLQVLMFRFFSLTI